MIEKSTVFWCSNCDKEAPAARLGPSCQSNDLHCIFCGSPDVVEESETVGEADAVT